jgi:hypothetical protein
MHRIILNPWLAFFIHQRVGCQEKKKNRERQKGIAANRDW